MQHTLFAQAKPCERELVLALWVVCGSSIDLPLRIPTPASLPSVLPQFFPGSQRMICNDLFERCQMGPRLDRRRPIPIFWSSSKGPRATNFLHSPVALPAGPLSRGNTTPCALLLSCYPNSSWFCWVISRQRLGYSISIKTGISSSSERTRSHVGDLSPH